MGDLHVRRGRRGGRVAFGCGLRVQAGGCLRGDGKHLWRRSRWAVGRGGVLSGSSAARHGRRKADLPGTAILATGQAPVEPTSTDWCADLAYRENGIAFLNLPRNPPRILGAFITFRGSDDSHDSGGYSAFVTSSDRTSIEFSKTCLTRLGYAPDCDKFAADFAAFGTGLGGVRDTSCTTTAAQGCLCSYTVEADAAGSNLGGEWVRREGPRRKHPDALRFEYGPTITGRLLRAR